MLKIAICDDEEYYRENIKKIVGECLTARNYEYSIEVFSSGENLVKLAAGLSMYQIVFLDIDMEGMNGIEVAKKLRQWSKDLYIIFVTAFIDYTLEGYKVEATRYILKEPETLFLNIEESIEAVLASLGVRQQSYEFDFKEGRRKLNIEQIVYVESRLHTVIVHAMVGGEKRIYTSYGKLDDFAMKLSENSMLRVHQSYFINMKYIGDMKRDTITLVTGEIIPIARGRIREVKERYLIYEGGF